MCSLSFSMCFRQQAQGISEEPCAWVITAAGSGGTLAGLVAGLRCIQSPLHPQRNEPLIFLHTGGLPALSIIEGKEFSHA